MTAHTTSSGTGRTIQLPSAGTMIGTVVILCVLLPMAVFLGDIVLTDTDPYRDEGPVASIVSIGLIGGVALVVAVGLAAGLVRRPERARIGAVVFAALAVLTVIIFWSGAPGMFGASAAWLAGLTRGGRPLGGAARVAGIVGAFVALLDIVLTIGGLILNAVV